MTPQERQTSEYNLRSALRDIDKHREASALIRQLLLVYGAEPGDDNPGIPGCEYNALQLMLGRAENAIMLLERAIPVYEQQIAEKQRLVGT